MPFEFPLDVTREGQFYRVTLPATAARALRKKFPGSKLPYGGGSALFWAEHGATTVKIPNWLLRVTPGPLQDLIWDQMKTAAWRAHLHFGNRMTNPAGHRNLTPNQALRAALNELRDQNWSPDTIEAITSIVHRAKMSGNPRSVTILRQIKSILRGDAVRGAADQLDAIYDLLARTRPAFTPLTENPFRSQAQTEQQFMFPVEDRLKEMLEYYRLPLSKMNLTNPDNLEWIIEHASEFADVDAHYVAGMARNVLAKLQGRQAQFHEMRRGTKKFSRLPKYAPKRRRKYRR